MAIDTGEYSITRAPTPPKPPWYIRYPPRFIIASICYLIGLVLVIAYVATNHPELLQVTLGGIAILSGILLGLE